MRLSVQVQVRQRYVAHGMSAAGPQLQVEALFPLLEVVMGAAATRRYLRAGK